MFTLRRMSYVLIHNLDTNITKEIARTIFSSAGQILEITIDWDENTESNNSFALIKYQNENFCEKAFENFNNRRVAGTFLKVEILKPDESSEVLDSKSFARRTEYKTKEKPTKFSPSLS